MTRIKSTPVPDRILTWSLDQPLTPLARYLAATLAIVIVAVLPATLITSLLPWLLFIPTIIAIALFRGERSGVYASVLAAVSAAITIGSLDEPWLLTGAQWAGSLLFVIIAIGLAHLTGQLREAFDRARVLTREAQEREGFLSSVLASSLHELTTKPANTAHFRTIWAPSI